MDIKFIPPYYTVKNNINYKNFYNFFPIVEGSPAKSMSKCPLIKYVLLFILSINTIILWTFYGHK